MTSEENKQAINNIKERLKSNLVKEKIHALLDAMQYGEEGIKLITSMLNDLVRKVRESAYMLLTEIDNDIAKQDIYDHLPFSQMQCLHVIDEFEFEEHNFNDTYPDYFAIADYDIVIWDLHEDKELVKLKGHTTPIGYLAMSSDREFIASYSIDTTIRIWGIPE